MYIWLDSGYLDMSSFVHVVWLCRWRKGGDACRSGASHSSKTEEWPMANWEPSDTCYVFRAAELPKPQPSERYVEAEVNNSCREDPPTALHWGPWCMQWGQQNCDGAVFCSLGGIVIPCGAQLRVDIVGSIYGYNCISCFLVDNCWYMSGWSWQSFC